MIKTLKVDGVTVRSDFGLYRDSGGNKSLILISIYGSPQQTKAVFSSLAENKPVKVLPDVYELDRPSALRGKGRAIGRGRQHMLIWSEEDLADGVVWFDENAEEKQVALGPFGAAEEVAFVRWLEKKKAPYEREYLQMLRERLIKDEDVIVFGSWGGIRGYEVSVEDDRLCDLMLKISGGEKAGEDNIMKGGKRGAGRTGFKRGEHEKRHYGTT